MPSTEDSIHDHMFVIIQQKPTIYKRKHEQIAFIDIIQQITYYLQKIVINICILFYNRYNVLFNRSYMQKITFKCSTDNRIFIGSWFLMTYKMMD